MKRFELVTNIIGYEKECKLIANIAKEYGVMALTLIQTIAQLGTLSILKASKVSLDAADTAGIVTNTAAITGQTSAIATQSTVAKTSGGGMSAFFKSIGAGLTSFGTAMAGPGGLGLAALVAAIIGVGFALKVAAPGIEAFGTVVTAAFAGIATLITTAADGFVKLMGAVSMDSIGPMLLLGPALFGISAGLGAMASVGFAALPVIGALVALGVVAPSLTGLVKAFGDTGGGGEEGTLKQVVDAITTLAASINSQPIVLKVDQNVIAETSRKGSNFSKTR